MNQTKLHIIEQINSINSIDSINQQKYEFEKLLDQTIQQYHNNKLNDETINEYVNTITNMSIIDNDIDIFQNTDNQKESTDDNMHNNLSQQVKCANALLVQTNTDTSNPNSNTTTTAPTALQPNTNTVLHQYKLNSNNSNNNKLLYTDRCADVQRYATAQHTNSNTSQSNNVDSSLSADDKSAIDNVLNKSNNSTVFFLSPDTRSAALNYINQNRQSSSYTDKLQTHNNSTSGPHSKQDK